MSSKLNLTILQCILYFMIGWMMGEHLTWGKLLIMFLVLLGIQIITHIKAVSMGMMFNQLMQDDIKFNKFIKKLKEESEGE